MEQPLRKITVLTGPILIVSFLLASCGGGSSDVSGDSNIAVKGTCSASISQQDALALLNAARSEARQCGSILYPAAPPLIWDAQLEAAAREHSEDMATRNFFSHTNPSGVTASQRTVAAGYGPQTGENISAGYPSLEAAMQGWLSSPGHCANIMRATYKHYAVACSVNNSSSFGTYWTQNFGSK
jgi:uncharacterized protein YkwD